MADHPYSIDTPNAKVELSEQTMRRSLSLIMRQLNVVKAADGWNDIERDLYTTIVQLRVNNPELA